MSDIVNIGVLGCAGIAARMAIPAILGSPDRFQLAGIASRDLEKARRFSKQFQARAFDGYQALIDLAGLQALYIPLPNALHAEWAEHALRRGLHVLVEKPLACEYGDALRLNDLARQKKLVLVENFQFRFHSQLAYLKELVHRRVIGELRCLRSSFGFPPLVDPDDIRYQKSLGGGALLDAGVYPVKIAQIFLGPEIEMKAASLNSAHGREVDIWGGAYAKQKHGDLFAELAFGFDHHYQCSIELWGSAGRIFTNRIFTADKAHPPVIEIETKAGKETVTLTADDHFRNMLEHFHELIHQRRDREEEYRQNVNQARLLHEIKLKSDE